MESDMAVIVEARPRYQRVKQERKKHGKIPPKTITMIPQETVCIDLVCPYTITDKLGTDKTLYAMLFGNPATG